MEACFYSSLDILTELLLLQSVKFWWRYFLNFLVFDLDSFAICRSERFIHSPCLNCNATLQPTNSLWRYLVVVFAICRSEVRCSHCPRPEEFPAVDRVGESGRVPAIWGLVIRPFVYLVSGLFRISLSLLSEADKRTADSGSGERVQCGARMRCISRWHPLKSPTPRRGAPLIYRTPFTHRLRWEQIARKPDLINIIHMRIELFRLLALQLPPYKRLQTNLQQDYSKFRFKI